ncbi:gephyrin-like molybdotransferase Glp [Paenibacillus solisilvae]|uniref:Molybdopterin molybdenumtransferase n=1 Tax=Paenibacillus solisilvae TaxID=2486751 RepID=A0ABW0W3K6_9BACL
MQQLQGASRFNRRAIKVEQAIQLVVESALPGEKERVPLWQAGGRRLAESLSATTDWPPFARSGMDGYAVRSADTVLASPDSPVTLRVLESVAAGELAAATVEPGCATRIMTGGAVPAGADAVVMLEQTADADLDGLPAVRVKAAASLGQNIAKPGEEFRLGSVIAEPGTRIRPGHAALLGTFGYANVPVFKRPRVAVIATGDELLPVTAPLVPGSIRDSNSAMVAALIEQSGGVPLQMGCMSDDPGAILSVLVQAYEQADLIVTTGGVSVGDFDVMAAVMRSIREGSGGITERFLDYKTAKLLFDKVAMKPGSPTSAALVDGKLLIALSGNPGACFVGFELFVKPALLRLQGASIEASQPRAVTAKLESDFDKGSPHVRFVRTRLFTNDGCLHADPLAFNKSSMLASIPEADGLIRIPAGPDGLAKGSIVEVLLLL